MFLLPLWYYIKHTIFDLANNWIFTAYHENALWLHLAIENRNMPNIFLSTGLYVQIRIDPKGMKASARRTEKRTFIKPQQ